PHLPCCTPHHACCPHSDTASTLSQAPPPLLAGSENVASRKAPSRKPNSTSSQFRRAVASTVSFPSPASSAPFSNTISVVFAVPISLLRQLAASRILAGSVPLVLSPTAARSNMGPD